MTFRSKMGSFLLCIATALTSSAQTLTTLHSFDSTDGQFPELLVQATNGSLYATTFEAGANGFGTVFKITPGGTFTLLDSFDATDGEYPYGAPLVQAANGNFYGTLQAGGANLTLCGGSGCGTFFKMTPAGTVTTLYNFCSQSNCTDGSTPLTGLALATDGNFYGTTFSGGANCIANGGCGTLFKITATGTLTTLYSFCAQSNCADGSNPRGLIQAANGDFYGTTKTGGANSAGTIFKVTPSGTLTTVYSFGSTDNSGLVSLQATDGNFYGTTHAGGANNSGTIFKMTPSGTVTTLYSFCAQSGCTDGNAPVGLLQDTNGKFYGSTEAGGTSSACTGGCGTIYSLNVGLRPFVETQPSSGNVGAPVNILGTNLSGATGVTFNGTAATFTVVSSSEIRSAVPTGATTGTVEVTVPSGVLKSNVVFRVRP